MSNIVVDEDGVGGCRYFKNVMALLIIHDQWMGSKSRKAENFNNLKSQCYFNLAEKNK